jgi:hypothetical protein
MENESVRTGTLEHGAMLEMLEERVWLYRCITDGVFTCVITVSGSVLWTDTIPGVFYPRD